MIQETFLGHGQAWSGSGEEEVAGFCEHGNELSGSIKYGKFFEYLSTCWLLKKVSFPLYNNISNNYYYYYYHYMFIFLGVKVKLFLYRPT
jgi:hypothetical protein